MKQISSMNDKKYIVYLGFSGFPYGMAELQKIILISKSLIDTGNKVTVVCRNGMHTANDHPGLTATGNHEGIDFVYTSGTPFRSDSFFTRNLNKVKAAINEFLLLRKMQKKGELDYAIISTNYYVPVLYYAFLSKLFGFKTILNYVEFYSGQKKKWFKFGMKINDILYDRFAPTHADLIFPISEFLIRRFKKTAPGKKYLKIPVLTDMERYNGIESVPGQHYFLFCGDASYDEIIKFNITAFEKLKTQSTFLYLVIGGSNENKELILEYIHKSPCKDRIKFLSRLSNRELSTYYKNALALLIPLRPTVQDEARFPHKIGEYLASGNPVISTHYGEVKCYFKDGEDMLIADRYEIDLFAEKMQFVLDNPADARKIGLKGKHIASSVFDYRAMGVAIDAFLNADLHKQPVIAGINEFATGKTVVINPEK